MPNEENPIETGGIASDDVDLDGGDAGSKGLYKKTTRPWDELDQGELEESVENGDRDN